MEALKDPVEAAAYLSAALEDGEPEVFLLALRDVVDSYGGISKLAASTGLNRENLYRMLSTKGNPEFFSLSTVLSAVGFRLGVEAKPGELPKAVGTVSQLVLYPHSAQIKEPTPEYALAADTEAHQRSQIELRTADDKEVGRLEFDHADSALVFYVTSNIPVKRVHEVEIQTRDGQTLTGSVTVEENRLVLLRKKRVLPKDISQITFTLVE